MIGLVLLARATVTLRRLNVFVVAQTNQQIWVLLSRKKLVRGIGSVRLARRFVLDPDILATNAVRIDQRVPIRHAVEVEVELANVVATAVVVEIGRVGVGPAAVVVVSEGIEEVDLAIVEVDLVIDMLVSDINN